MPSHLGSATPTLTCDRVVLRGFVAEDATARARLGQDAAIVRMFGSTPAWSGIRAMTEHQGQSWYRAVTSGSDDRTNWAIELDGRFVGSARLHHLSEEDRKARYAIGILDASLHGNGLGREVTQRILQHAFDDLHLHRVDLRVLAFNEPAIRCYRACGFVEEGRERESAYVDGKWHDDVIMGVLAHEHP
ncbi:GNAT family N-acetyltransferase [Nocardioides humilatus]|uniref:GNAT family N-acetyltransferase n=1 Tax=Nocardioides humilatus TaxID=2607660 RepID=A0A5B1LA04_9ACTN|nr:GNAT family protein [Nocardioides humilatus]KAA1417028.1 GNAT family N-acetyltransferase [Nocardioides humilatus]